MRFYSLNENDIEQFKNRKVMKGLIKSFNKNDSFLNYKAAEALSEFDDNETVETLLTALNEDDDSVREMVINTLGRIGDKNAITPLISNFDDVDGELKELVILALGEIGGKKSLDYIKLALNEDNLEIRLRAIEALGKISNPESIEELVYMLLDDNLEIKLYAIASLGEIGDSNAIKPLIKFLNHRKWIVRKYTLNSLGKIVECPIEPFINALEDDDYHVREKAVEIIGIRGDENSINSLNLVLNDSDDDVKIRANEILRKHNRIEFNNQEETLIKTPDKLDEFIHKIGKDKVVEILIEYLDDDNPEIMDEEAKSPEENPDENIVNQLIKELSDGNYSVWWNAKEELKKIDGPAVMPLIKVLDDEDPKTRWRVVYTLTEICDERAIIPLIKQLEKENDSMKMKIALSLSKFGENAITPLTTALNDKNSVVRENAAEALGEISDPKALISLENALNDENPYVRKRVKEAIKAIKTKKME
ncbi:MAG: HEAT repeat domain-containing protein [Methanobacterium sp.]